MPAIVAECPLCGTDTDNCRVVTHQIPIVVCDCGMAYQQLYMTPEENKKFYRTKYRATVPPYKKDMTEENLTQEIKRGNKNVRIINTFGIRPKRHLDIGSSSGTFLNMMNEIYGCASLGVEPYDKFREYSFSNGVTVVADISKVKGKFDLITMVHVLEHLVKPMEMLSGIHDLLEDDGYFFLEVPHFMLCTSHPLLFLPEVLKKMITKANFKIQGMGKGNIRGDIWAMATHSN